MALLTTGTAVTENLIFNQGILTVNSQKLADLDDITVTQEFDIKGLPVIGSIFDRVLRRSHGKFSIKAKAFSFNMALLQYLYASSAVDGSGEGYTMVDGQPGSITGLAITTYIDTAGTNSTSQPIQLQPQNPILKTGNITFKKQDFSETEIEIDCTQIYLYNGATSL